MIEQSKLFDALPTPCVITDLNGYIESSNESLADLIGKSRQNLYGTQLDMLVSLASRVFMQTHVWPMLRKDGAVREIFLKITDARGESQPVMANCDVRVAASEPNMTNGNVGENSPVEKVNIERSICYWVFYVAQERSKFEKELIATRQEVESINTELTQSQSALQLANEELERFSYSVSHDLRAPLISISGFAKQLKSELAESLNERQLRRFDRIDSNVLKMRDLMDDLLQLSKITLQDIQFENLSLQQVVAEQLGLLEQPLAEANVTLIIAADLPEVLSNRVLLGQCIANLLTNAIAYREPERPLVIGIQAVSIGTHVELQLSDNGIGIKEPDQQKIFHMFEHLSPAKGTGVGLAIVKTAMAKINGSITVRSEFGIGTTFHLVLPNPKMDKV